MGGWGGLEGFGHHHATHPDARCIPFVVLGAFMFNSIMNITFDMFFLVFIY